MGLQEVQRGWKRKGPEKATKDENEEDTSSEPDDSGAVAASTLQLDDGSVNSIISGKLLGSELEMDRMEEKEQFFTPDGSKAGVEDDVTGPIEAV